MKFLFTAWLLLSECTKPLKLKKQKYKFKYLLEANLRATTSDDDSFWATAASLYVLVIAFDISSDPITFINSRINNTLQHNVDKIRLEMLDIFH